jgi:hypothetical protein
MCHLGAGAAGTVENATRVSAAYSAARKSRLVRSSRPAAILICSHTHRSIVLAVCIRPVVGDRQGLLARMEARRSLRNRPLRHRIRRTRQLHPAVVAKAPAETVAIQKPSRLPRGPITEIVRIRRKRGKTAFD